MARCDVAVIGSGHNGLALAAYCARLGLDVVVLEAAPKVGGLLSTEEVTLPGFRHNLHAVTLGSYAPFYRDFDLRPFGARFVRPPVEYVMPVGDRHLTIRCGDPVANYHAIAGFSRHDAETIRDLYHRFHQTWLGEFYAPPRPAGQRGRGLPGEDQRAYARLCAMSFRAAVDEVFESEELRLFFCLRAMELTGDVGLGARSATADYPGTGDFLFRLAFDEEYQIVLGGTNELGQAIARLLAHLGATVRTGRPVARILIADGRAHGVQLADGETLQARAVVSAANFAHTMLDLVGRAHLDPRFVERVEALQPSRGGKFDVHLAVSTPPRYRIPEAREALCLFLGYDGLEDIETRWAEVVAGRFPATPSFHCGCTSLYDPDSVPGGGHTLYLWQFVPAALSRAMTEAAAAEYLERILARWRQYTPDLGDERILGRHAYYLANWTSRQAHPYGGVPVSHGQYYDRRPLAECADYRTPIAGLYLCAAASHPGGSVRFAPAYNAARVVAEDFGLKPWWSEALAPGTPLVAGR
jgi:phytoene dehydrogenase-like protein